MHKWSSHSSSQEQRSQQLGFLNAHPIFRPQGPKNDNICLFGEPSEKVKQHPGKHLA